MSKADTVNVHHVRRGAAIAGEVIRAQIDVFGELIADHWEDVLLPHGEDMSPTDWTRDGRTTQPDFGCMALTAKKVRCPKEGVVTLIWVEPEPPINILPLDLCGGHFGMHRRGREVPMW